MKISQTLLLFLTFFSIIYCEFEAEEEARIRIDGKNEWKIERQPSEEYLYIATAYYSPGINESGWDFLSITTNNQFSDELQAEAAGRLEASLTKNKIYTHYTNMLSTAGHLKNDTAQFFIRQEEFLLSKKDEYKSDSILYNAYLLYLQFKGLRDQYNKEADDDKKIEDVEFNVMNSFGDVFDINSKYNRPSFDEMDKEEIYNYFALNNHCSAIFKLKYDLSDIFFGHNSWYYSNMMTKMFKEYNLNFNHDSIKTHNVMFSSYPGSIVSNDDFYFTSTGLVVIETTNANYNQSAFDLINEESLLCWQRVQISNRMSGSAKEWTETFAIYNSGTYNNQYMVLDTKKIEIGNITKIPDNSLMIIEQMPGFIEANDVTNHLKFGYWPSYNVPYSKNISDYANVTNTINSKPERNMKLYSQYNSCSRAKIMRRDQNNIHDIESMKYFMHYNDYKNDPFSEGEPGESIAARYDLREKNARCYGAYDTKLSSVQEIKKSEKKSIYLYCGATRQVEPPFNFNCDACKNVKHEGIPDEPNFDWVVFNNKFNFDE
jgi:hypothetical protein